MLSALNSQLSLIEQTLSEQSSLLAQLQLVEFDRRSRTTRGFSSHPSTTSPADPDIEDNEECRQLDKLQNCVLRLRSQVVRSLRRIDRLQAVVDRQDAQLADIRNRLICSSGGCALIRPDNEWTSSGTRTTVNDREKRSATSGTHHQCPADDTSLRYVSQTTTSFTLPAL